MFAMKSLAAVAALMLAGSPLLAQDQNSEQNASEVSDNDDAMVCKRLAQTGTRVKKRVCYTAAEWERAAEQARKFRSDLEETPNSQAPQ